MILHSMILSLLFKKKKKGVEREEEAQTYSTELSDSEASLHCVYSYQTLPCLYLKERKKDI